MSSLPDVVDVSKFARGLTPRELASNLSGALVVGV
jgi:hypothetical protein